MFQKSPIACVMVMANTAGDKGRKEDQEEVNGFSKPDAIE